MAPTSGPDCSGRDALFGGEAGLQVLAAQEEERQEDDVALHLVEQRERLLAVRLDQRLLALVGVQLGEGAHLVRRHRAEHLLTNTCL